MKKLNQIISVIMLSLIVLPTLCSLSKAWPATIQLNSSDQTAPTNLTGTQQIRIYGTGGYGTATSGSFGSVAGCLNPSTIGYSGTTYAYTIPKYQWGSEEIAVHPTYYDINYGGISGSGGHWAQGHGGTQWYSPISSAYDDLYYGDASFSNVHMHSNYAYVQSGAHQYNDWGGNMGSQSTNNQHTYYETYNQDNVDFSAYTHGACIIGGGNSAWSQARVECPTYTDFDPTYSDTSGWSVSFTVRFYYQGDGGNHGPNFCYAQVYYRDTAEWATAASYDCTTYGLTYTFGQTYQTWSATFSGAQAYRILKGGAAMFRIIVQSQGGWPYSQNAYAGVDYAFVTCDYSGSRLPTEGSTMNCVTVNRGSISNSGVSTGWMNARTDSLGLTFYDPDTLMNSLSFDVGSFTCAERRIATPSRFGNALQGKAYCNGNPSQMVTHNDVNYYWIQTYANLMSQPTNIYDPFTGTCHLTVTYDGTGFGYNGIEYFIALKFGQFVAIDSVSYPPVTNFIFHQSPQQWLACSFTHLEFPSSPYLTSVELPYGTPQTFVYYNYNGFSGDEPTYDIGVNIPVVYQNFPIYTDTAFSYMFYEEIRIPACYSPSHPIDGEYAEFTPSFFAVHVNWPSGEDTSQSHVLLAYNHTSRDGSIFYPAIACELTHQGPSGYYDTFTTFDEGNYTIWFVAQDSAGNWGTMGAYHLNFTAQYPEVFSNNGSEVSVDRGFDSPFLNFTIEGAAGGTYNVSIDGITAHLGTWAVEPVITEEDFSLSTLELGDHVVSCNATNTAHHWTKVEVLVHVYSSLPTVTSANGTDVNVYYNSIGNIIEWHLGAASPAYYNVTQDGTPVVSRTTWTSPYTVTYSVDGLPVGNYLFNCSANNTNDLSANATINVHVGNWSPMVSTVNGSSCHEILGTPTSVNFTMLTQEGGNYDLYVTHNGAVILHNSGSSWPIGADRSVYFDESTGYGVYNVTVIAVNKWDITVSTQVETDLTIVAPPSLITVPASQNIPEDSGMHNLTFTIAGTSPDFYRVTMNGSLVGFGNWFDSVPLGVLVNTSLPVWGVRSGSYTDYNITIFAQNIFAQSVAASFLVHVFATTPVISHQVDFTVYISTIDILVNWQVSGVNVIAYHLDVNTTDIYGHSYWRTIFSGVFNDTGPFAQTSNLTLRLDGLFSEGVYEMRVVANNSRSHNSEDGFTMTVLANPPSVQFNLQGLFIWFAIGLVVIGLVLALSRGRNEVYLKHKKPILGAILGGVAVTFVVLSLFNISPFYAYRLPDILAQINATLGSFGPLVLVGGIAAIIVVGFLIFHTILKRRKVTR